MFYYLIFHSFDKFTSATKYENTSKNLEKNRIFMFLKCFFLKNRIQYCYFNVDVLKRGAVNRGKLSLRALIGFATYGNYSCNTVALDYDYF